MFQIDERLKNDTIFFRDMNLSRLHIMNDNKYPWFILIPRIENVYEITDLSFDDQVKMLQEVNIVASFLKQKFNYDKLNVASLGNVVKQLHVHVIARFEKDHSFPAPVWCSNKAVQYNESEVKNLINEFNDYYAQR